MYDTILMEMSSRYKKNDIQFDKYTNCTMPMKLKDLVRYQKKRKCEEMMDDERIRAW